MTQAFTHRPVMVDEVVDLLADVPAGLFVDATLGGAGHASAVLDANAGLRLIGIDRDADALVAAEERLRPYGDRVVALHHARFDRLLPVIFLATCRGCLSRLRGSWWTIRACRPLP